MKKPLRLIGGVLAALALGWAGPSGAAAGCTTPQSSLGVTRIVEIDASGGPIFGKITRFAGEPRFLAPKEVVLTFDDGPVPRITRSILKTLATFCTKATFFPVGRMAIAYPEVVRETIKAGHSIGAHTWSHPYNMRRLKKSAAETQLEKGFAAIAMAAGVPIAPFFRFPGLNDDKRILTYLQERGVATFTVDVVSDDSYTSDPKALVKQTIARTIALNGGILLFHDIKMSTALALPEILSKLKTLGFKVVHLKSKHEFTPLGTFEAELGERLTKATDGKPLANIALKDTVHPVGSFAIVRPPVTQLAPAAKIIELAAVREQRVKALRGTGQEKGWATTIDQRKRKDKPE